MDDNDDTLNSQDEYDEKIKIMVIGESKIGKTSLISRYCNNEFFWWCIFVHNWY